LHQSKKLNEVLSMNFMGDSLQGGRTYKVLNVIDYHNRECLKSKGDISFSSRHGLRELEQLWPITETRRQYEHILGLNSGLQIIRNGFRKRNTKSRFRARQTYAK